MNGIGSILSVFLPPIILSLIVGLIIYLVAKHRGAKARNVILFVAAIAVAVLGWEWYLTPIDAPVPENPAFELKHSGVLIYRPQEQAEINAIAQLLDTLQLQREPGAKDRSVAVKSGDGFYIVVSNADDMQYGLPARVGSYSFVISQPERSIYSPWSDNSAYLYKILNAESIIDELYELVKSSKPSIDE